MIKLIKLKSWIAFIYVWIRYRMWTKKQKKQHPKWCHRQVYVSFLRDAVFGLNREFEEELMLLKFPKLKKSNPFVERAIVDEPLVSIQEIGSHTGIPGKKRPGTPSEVHEPVKHPLSYEERRKLEFVHDDEKEEARRDFKAFEAGRKVAKEFNKAKIMDELNQLVPENGLTKGAQSDTVGTDVDDIKMAYSKE
jgi:hypothetical protein